MDLFIENLIRNPSETIQDCTSLLSYLSLYFTDPCSYEFTSDTKISDVCGLTCGSCVKAPSILNLFVSFYSSE